MVLLKRLAKWCLIALGLPIIALYISFYLYFFIQSSQSMSLAGIGAPTLSEGGVEFRDLNKNGVVDDYEDHRLDADTRVENLLAQMTLSEKAGLMFINGITLSADGSQLERPELSNPMSLATDINSTLIFDLKMSHFNVFEVPDIKSFAIWNNNIQQLAERTRLGIPVTLASDPRHSVSHDVLTAAKTRGFSQWPESLGLAATRDEELVYQFANIARQEYLALGFRLALHPMADLATEPRWSRIKGTFGEDAELSSKLIHAYIKGFQGDALGKDSVATMVKHFAGGGPQKDGWDAHWPEGKEQIYPGDNLEYHLKPFVDGAFEAGSAQVMTYYGIPVGQTNEDVAFTFNQQMITGLLREKLGFEGVVVSDYGIFTEAKMLGVLTAMPAKSWGVEELTLEQRLQKALDAGIDMFGGESLPKVLVEMVDKGLVTQQRLDDSVRRILRDKFRLGLFDNPYVEVSKVDEVVGQKDFVEAGRSAQRKSIVLLKNGKAESDLFLPLKENLNIYIENINSDLAQQYGNIVTDLELADVAILRLSAPYESIGEYFLQRMAHQGSLAFKPDELNRILNITESVPTVIDIYLDRPAVIPELSKSTAALLASFGVSDDALLDVVFGKFNPVGKLPVEMPSSMEAVEGQKEDLPYDSVQPLYRFGHGLSYAE